jgi:hypothetical protein
MDRKESSMKITELWSDIALNIGEIAEVRDSVKSKKIGKNSFGITAPEIEISYVAIRKLILGLDRNDLLRHTAHNKCLACELLKWVEKPSSFSK